MAISVQITSATLTEGNSAVTSLVPTYTYLRDKSIINYAISVKWSGASKVTAVETTIEVKNSAGTRVGWVLAKEEKTTATSDTKTYTGTFFSPVLSSGYGPGVTSLDDGVYTVVCDFSVWNGSSGTGVYPASTFTITYATLNAPTVTAFDVYRASSSGTRADDGTYIRYTVQASISKVAPTDTGTFVLRYRQSGVSSWMSLTLGSNVASDSTTAAALSGTYPVSNSYDFELVITDKYTSVTSAKTVPTASVLMHFKSDKTGIGIGKYAETSNLLDVALPTKMGNAVGINTTASSNLLDVNVPARFRQSVSMDAPLPITSGGTGANSVAGARQNLDIRAGVMSSVSVNKNALNTFTVTFSPARSTVPTAVLVNTYGNATTNLQYWRYGSGNFSTTGCSIYAYRDPTESGTGTISLQWIAI